MWGPGDTGDIHIPSVFVSSASYEELLRLYRENSSFAVVEDDNSQRISGLSVILSRDEQYDWPLSDLLLALLFLPSILTLLTLIMHRLRAARQRRLDRAPQDAVDNLSWVRWGYESEKEATNAANPVLRDGDEPIQSDRVEANKSWYSRLIPLHYRRQKPTVVYTPANSPLPFSVVAQQRLFASQRECAICLSSFEDGDMVRVLPCGHLFHLQEVDSWLLRTKRMCPTCRMSITKGSPSSTALSNALHGLPINSTAPLDLNETSQEDIIVASSSNFRVDDLPSHPLRTSHSHAVGPDERTPLLSTFSNQS